MNQPTHEELEALTKKLKPAGPKIIRNPDGTINYSKLDPKIFWLILGPIILIAAGLVIFVSLGYTPGVGYQGVAYNESAKQCAYYKYRPLVMKQGEPLPRPAGWKLSAIVMFEESSTEGLDYVTTPFGDCQLDNVRDCCERGGYMYQSTAIDGEKYR